MALSYPHQFTVDGDGKLLEFEDGLRITIACGTFDDEYTVTIDKKEPVDVAGYDIVSKGYEIVYEGGVPDPVPPTTGKTPYVHVPLTQTVSLSQALAVLANPSDDYPDPVDWTPQPDNFCGVTQDITFCLLDQLASFEVAIEL